jgi:transcription antitermination factor NusG
MPILAHEPDLYPEHLFDAWNGWSADASDWWVLHTRPRQEKALARDLCARGIPHYLPLLPRRFVSRGRLLTCYVPLFPGYAFLLADPSDRVAALATGRVVQSLAVRDQQRLWHDLQQIHRLLRSGAQVRPEDRLAPGTKIEIRTGALAGLRGVIQRSVSGHRFIVMVDFIQRGASVLLDDFNLALAG